MSAARVILVGLLFSCCTAPYQHTLHELNKACQQGNSEQMFALGNQLLGLGNQAFQDNNLEQAAEIFTALSNIFSSGSVFYNLGYVLNELSQPHAAIAAYRKALTGNQQSAQYHYALSTALLAAGDHAAGWQEYEWRWQLPDKQIIGLPLPRLDGSCLQGKTLLLLCEGAFGDALQFIRYAQLVKQQGATVVLLSPTALKPLFSLCPFLDYVVTNKESIPRADYYCSLMSLPYYCGTISDATVPATIPYLFTRPDLDALWGQTLARDTHFSNTQFKVGICWQADLHNDANRPLIAQRTVPVTALQPLLELSGTSFYSLQKDPTELIPGIISFADLDTTHGAFMDTAALIKQLNLVITVDTSIAHLSGALGIPTLLILPFKSDWRWMVERTDTPWYPTMTLYRKKQNETWNEVIQQIIPEIIKRAEKRS